MTDDPTEPEDSTDDLPWDEGVEDSNSSGGDDFGMGDISSDGPTENPDFEDEDLKSDLPRFQLGIDGLDALIHGGIPKQSMMVVVGEPGTGKTTFAMQFLNQALNNGENAVYITLEEGRKQVIRSADEKGYRFEDAVEEKQLAVIGYDPIEMKNSLTNITDQLPSLIEEHDASRLVIDSVSLLEMMYSTESERRNQIYDFLTTLQDSGVTTLLTSEASKEHTHTSRYGLVEYLTDAWFMLRYVRSDSFTETRMAVEIQKIRDTKHSRAVRPYELGDDGLEVYTNSAIF